jgi:hypothetical protein
MRSGKEIWELTWSVLRFGEPGRESALRWLQNKFNTLSSHGFDFDQLFTNIESLES